jgi:A/G-specific adenine glycosylase
MTGAARVPRRALVRSLLAWYDVHRRPLPWRGTHDPYAVWVSEMMLQQTQVATVVDYFDRWMVRFPSLRALAEADEQDVLAAWQGLGYYSRARNLHRGAQMLVRDRGGQLPSDPDALRSIPGIGAYSAGAIASIAFNRPVPLVDGNVARVLSRLLVIEGDAKSSAVAKQLWATAARLVPADRPGDFNQALMELGATVCTPRAPACETCPIRRQCVARRDGRQDELPTVVKRRETVAVHRVAAVVEHRARFLTVQLSNGPRWKGLWIFPTADVRAPGRAELELLGTARKTAGTEVEQGDLLCTVRHSFTHHRISLDAYRCTLTRGARPRLRGDARWHTLEELEALPMPAPYRKIGGVLGR